jgi:hypothetical protein
MIKDMLQSLLKFCFKYFTGIFSLILLGILWSDLPAQTLPEKPREWVNDYAGILNNQEKQSLNSTLRAYEDTTSNQIVVAIFQNARGYPVEDYSIRLAEKWQVGQKGINEVVPENFGKILFLRPPDNSETESFIKVSVRPFGRSVKN